MGTSLRAYDAINTSSNESVTLTCNSKPNPNGLLQCQLQRKPTCKKLSCKFHTKVKTSKKKITSISLLIFTSVISIFHSFQVPGQHSTYTASHAHIVFIQELNRIPTGHILFDNLIPRGHPQIKIQSPALV